MPISQNILMMLEGEKPKEKKKPKIVRYFSGEVSNPKKKQLYDTIKDDKDPSILSPDKKLKVLKDVKSDYKSSIKSKQNRLKVYRSLGTATAVIGSGKLAHMGYKSAISKTPSEKAQAMASSVKDVIKNKIMEHPKTAATLGVAGALGTGYGAYRYLKGREKNKE